MTFWLAVTTPGNWVPCQETGTWGVTDRHKGAIQDVQTGDLILVYVQGMTLAGIVRVTSPYFHSDERIWEDDLYPHRISFQPELVPEKRVGARQFFYSFFPGTAPSGYFRTAFRRLPEDQFELFRDFLREGHVQVIEEEEPVSVVEEEFAVSLEKDLEDFLEKRLQMVEEGLHLYVEEGRGCRQYDTDVSRIDLLAKDKSDDFVVIELKAGRADKKSLAQILPYMGWVREYLAEGKEVRGIIVASDFSTELVVAINVLTHLSLYKYSVSFSFEKIMSRMLVKGR